MLEREREVDRLVSLIQRAGVVRTSAAARRSQAIADREVSRRTVGLARTLP